ncbi:MAG: hypothetical protein IJK63_09735 [Oscillospiraceae bacterium]|nr:hypothetical protein [Oscillospiraceae bacterium]
MKGRHASAVYRDLITSGSRGIYASFTFDAVWDDLTKIAVFEGSERKIDVELTGESCEVPPEVMEMPTSYLRIGVYGVDGTGSIVIPTVYASVRRIEQGTDPSGEHPAEKTKTLVEKLMEAAQAARDAAAAAERLAQSVRDDADAGEFDGEDGNGIWWTVSRITSTGVPGYGEIRASYLKGRSGAPAAHDLVVGPLIGETSSIANLYEISSVVGQYCALRGIGTIKGVHGDPGFAPEVTIETIPGGTRITITSAAHPEGQSFDVMDGAGGGSDAFTATYTLGQTSTCDKTYAEIMAAWLAGQTVFVRATGVAVGQTANVYASQSGDLIVIVTLTAASAVRLTHTSADAISWVLLGIDATDIQYLDQFLVNSGYYRKPATGIPASDLEEGAIPTVPRKTSELQNDSGFVQAGELAEVAKTGNYNDLEGKPSVDESPTSGSDALVKSGGVAAAIASAVAGVTQIRFAVVQALPAVGADGTIYLVPNSGSGSNIYDEYIYVNGAYERLGTTEVDLTGYRKAADQDTIDQQQNAAIAAKYAKPGTGIPKTDLAAAVQTSLGRADTALQQHQDISGKADKVQGITVATDGAVSQTVEPGKAYHFTGELTALTITTATPGEGHYHLDFVSSATAPTVTLPGAWIMPNGFQVEANTRYEIDVLDGYAVAQGWGVSA